MGPKTYVFQLRASRKPTTSLKLSFVMAVDVCAPTGILPIEADFYPRGRQQPSCVKRGATPTYMTIMGSLRKCPPP